MHTHEWSIAHAEDLKVAATMSSPTFEDSDATRSGFEQPEMQVDPPTIPATGPRKTTGPKRQRNK